MINVFWNSFKLPITQKCNSRTACTERAYIHLGKQIYLNVYFFTQSQIEWYYNSISSLKGILRRGEGDRWEEGEGMGEGGLERLRREQRMGTGARTFRGSNVQAFPPKNNLQSLKICESKLVTTILGEQGPTPDSCGKSQFSPLSGNYSDRRETVPSIHHTDASEWTWWQTCPHAAWQLNMWLCKETVVQIIMAIFSVANILVKYLWKPNRHLMRGSIISISESSSCLTNTQWAPLRNAMCEQSVRPWEWALSPDPLHLWIYRKMSILIGLYKLILLPL